MFYECFLQCCLYAHSYLDDQVFERLLILRRVLIKLVLQAVNRKNLKIDNALIALLHFLKARLIVAASDHLAMLNLLVLHGLLVPLGQLDELILVDPFRLVLAVTLALDLDLKGFLVSILSHHALQFEGVAVQLHTLVADFLEKFFNLN